jgi:hypothetical protein
MKLSMGECIFGIAACVFFGGVAVMATLDRNNIERELQTEIACYSIGYYDDEHSVQSCEAAKSEYQTNYICDHNECWAELR